MQNSRVQQAPIAQLGEEGQHVRTCLAVVAVEDVNDLTNDLVNAHRSVAALKNCGGDGRECMRLPGVGIDGDTAQVIEYAEFDRVADGWSL